MPRNLLLGILAATLMLSSAAQSVPQLINYQGRLTDAIGTELPTSDYRLSFSVYDAAQSGNRVWGPQTLQAIPVVKGFFNVMLGPADDTQRSIVEAFKGPSRWIEITIGDNPPLAPRQQILSAPFALAAQHAASAETASRAANADLAARATLADSVIHAPTAQNAANADKLAGFDWSALFGVNNPTAKIDGNRIATASIGSNQIGFATITRSNMAPGSVSILHLAPLEISATANEGGLARSPGVVGFETRSTDYVTVTGSQLSLRTTGRPVELFLVGYSPGGVAESQVYIRNVTASVRADAQISLLRGGQPIHVFWFGSPVPGAALVVPPGAFRFIDEPAKGTSHVYSLQGRVVDGNSSLGITNVRLIAREW